MPAFYRALLPEFLRTSTSELAGCLSRAYAQSGFTNQKTAQTIAWVDDLERLRAVLDDLQRQQPETRLWSVLLEFPIPRKEARVDVVVLAKDTVFLLELKGGSGGVDAARQAEQYALLLHYFHQPSDRRRIVPLVVTATGKQNTPKAQLFLPIVEAPGFWIAPVRQIQWQDLGNLLTEPELALNQPIEPEAWDAGEYRPVPTIIDAALSLQSGLGIREIAHSRAERCDVEKLTSFVEQCIDEARQTNTRIICFVTGVPGSGKTLVGLNLAFSRKAEQDPIHFMSGTGPLVKVLQAALAADHCRRMSVPAAEGRMKAKTLIENVHVFAKYYAEENRDRAPSNHVIIFDEAQRAWDKKQNLAKFNRHYSEPEMLLSIMERHDDWAVVIALVGGGQEINNGEAGLEEWGCALASAKKPWKVFASPEALAGGSAVAGSQLFSAVPDHGVKVQAESQLHLKVSVRSLGAATYSEWVSEVIDGNADAAQRLAAKGDFAVMLTRSVRELRMLLKEHALGESRCGLVASSGAARLRADGFEPDSTFHGEYPWHHWYLAARTDVRSSHQLEVFATEFEIQGLELDWIGVLWGGDFLWSPAAGVWQCSKFAHKRNSAWSRMRQERHRRYRRNAYRVLLTRARQGVVIYVPTGDSDDPTQSPDAFNATAEFLLQCGVKQVTTNPTNSTINAPPAYELNLVGS